jgi:hypothetical protein
MVSWLTYFVVYILDYSKVKQATEFSTYSSELPIGKHYVTFINKTFPAGYLALYHKKPNEYRVVLNERGEQVRVLVETQWERVKNMPLNLHLDIPNFIPPTDVSKVSIAGKNKQVAYYDEKESLVSLADFLETKFGNPETLSAGVGDSKRRPLFKDLSLTPQSQPGIYRADSYLLPTNEPVYMFGEMRRGIEMSSSPVGVGVSSSVTDNQFVCTVMGSSKDRVVDAVGSSRDMEINARILASSIGLYCSAFLVLGAVLKKK